MREDGEPTFDPANIVFKDDDKDVVIVTEIGEDEYGNEIEIEVEKPAQLVPPKSIKKTGKRKDVLYVAGKGNLDADIMFIQTSLFETEATYSSYISKYGTRVKENPEHLNGPHGDIINNCCSRAQLDLTKCYYTSLCKWLLPKQLRSKPKTPHIAWAKEALLDEIKRVNPKIIVCLGKPQFDLLTGLKISLKDCEGGWFRCKDFPDIMVYPTVDPFQALVKPEYVDKYDVDFKEVKQQLDILNGITIPHITQKYSVISNKSQLEEFMKIIETDKPNMLSVDCEWAGDNHYRGQLRSLQVCWKEGVAVYIKFRDDNIEYTFDIAYKEVGEILGTYFNRPEVKYVGHLLAADFVWMQHVLGLEVYQKAAFDTLFAQQNIDESADLKLEKMAMKYTDMHRYDIDLILWKKANGVSKTDGYGRIPDDIIIPYGCRDVDAVFRMVPILTKELFKQSPKLLKYYSTIRLPFVTDIFTNFTDIGLPISRIKMEELREVMLTARDRLFVKFQKNVQEESMNLLFKKLVEVKLKAREDEEKIKQRQEDDYLDREDYTPLLDDDFELEGPSDLSEKEALSAFGLI